MLDLLDRDEPPPARGKGLDWQRIASAAGIEEDVLAGARDAFRPGFEALRREIQKAPQRRSARRTSRFPSPKQAADTANSPARIDDTPDPPNDDWEDVPEFHEAFDLHMQRNRDTPTTLHRALLLMGYAVEASTLRMWRHGIKAPNHVESFAILNSIEERYRLPHGYLKAKLAHPCRAAKGQIVHGIRDSERRRLAWHLPDDFSQRSTQEREEILEWVRRVVVSGATDYRLYQAAAVKQRYAVRFPGLHGKSGGRSGLTNAPPQLAAEMAALVRFKTSILTPLGYHRRGTWGTETTSQKLEHLGLMFGALAASPGGPVRGYGVPLPQLSFALLVMPQVWDWYVQWREQRRGFYTAWESDMLAIAAALSDAEAGWLTQTPELAHRLEPIPGLTSAEDVLTVKDDWHAACARLHKHALARAKEIGRVSRVHRDPFEPILAVLEADSPAGEYRKIADEALRLMPCPRRYPKAAAETARSFLLIRLGLHLGFRQKNLRQLLVRGREEQPSTERQLVDAKRGELRWSDRNNGWEVFVPANAFKNAGSSFFGGRPFRLILPDLGGLYDHIDAWITRHRKVLIGPGVDPGTFFVKTVKRSSTDAAYDRTTFYEAWRWTIQRYGIFNPYTGRGAIAGLLPHGPHNVRDVLATHILKQTGSHEQASYAIQDTPEMVAQHYGRFLPRDKAALAAQILNKIWEEPAPVRSA